MIRFALPVLMLLLAACSSVTPEQYNKLEAGMSREQVYDILGKPDEVSGGSLGSLSMSGETWNGPKHRVNVSFVGDKLATRSIESADAERK